MPDRPTSEPDTSAGMSDAGGGLQELKLRRVLALRMGGEDPVRRQHEAGRLTIRERIREVTDPGSFRELGMLAGTGRYDESNRLIDVTPAPYVCGIAKVDGRPVAIGGEDFTVRGGTSFGSTRRKGGQGGLVEDIAFHYRIPLINLVDGAGGSVNSMTRHGYSVLPGVHGFERSVELLDSVPVVSAVLGSAAGGPAGRAILSHFSVMVRRTSHIFAAGPPVVKRALGETLDKTELGGADVAVDTGGNIHNAVESEAEAFEQIRRFLSFMPSNVWQLPPVMPTDDPVHRCAEELATIVPQQRSRAYSMRALLGYVLDQGSQFEIQPTFGKSVITSLGRLGGRAVGVIASNPMVLGGAVDAKAARKQVHFIEMCDTFHIPLIFFADVPGFMVGRKAEQEGTLREGMRVVQVVAKLSVPIVTVIVRKCYGMAGMATTNKNGADIKLAWPSAEWGSLPIPGGVAAAYRREIMDAEDPKSKEKEIEEELKAYASPFRTAEAFAVEEVIDPRETRPILCEFIELAENRLAGTIYRLGACPRSVNK